MNDKESAEKALNVKSHTRRKRQWQTVESDSPDGSDSESDSGSAHHRSDRGHSSRSSTKHIRRQDSSNSDDSYSDSGSDSEDRKTKRHSSKDNDKKHKKHRKDDKKDRKKESKHKKDKKDPKKDRKKHSSSHKSPHRDRHRSSSASSSASMKASTAINQNEYGKYGIIKEVDFFNKQREFEAYMSEVKKLPDVMGQGKREMMMHFKSFIEDFNTATMPHDKYYNYEAWEVAEYRRRQQQEQQQRARQVDGLDGDYADGGVIGGCYGAGKGNGRDGGAVDLRADEEERRQLRKQQKAAAEQAQLLQTVSYMKSDQDKQMHMRRQAALAVEQQVAYKRGDSATVKRVDRLIKPDENVKAVKHPWA